MALYGSNRDISLFRNINRELMGDVISQQCAIYKVRLEETIDNIYGEANDEKFYDDPILLYCLIERSSQNYPTDELGVDFQWSTQFRFLRDDLIESNILPEVGDIILYQEGYYEITKTNANQYFMGKNPDYPNAPNPLENRLDEFGYSVSIICDAVYVPADRVAISKERF